MAKHIPISERPLINQKVLEARKWKGLTQEQAAQKMGMLRDTYQRMESRGNIKHTWVLKFCDVLDVPRSFFKDIFEDKPIKEEEPPKKLVLRSPSTIEEKIYGNEPKVEAPQIPKKENNITVCIEVTHTENSLINIYRGLSKPKQKEVFKFVNSIK